MNKSPSKAKPDILKRLRRAFAGLSRCPLLKLRDAYRLVDESVKVPAEAFPIQLLLGRQGKRLHLYPEYPLQMLGKTHGPPSFLLEDPDHSDSGIRGFVRLEPGKKLVLGRHDPKQQALFNYPEDVALRHLHIVHAGDAVVFKDKTKVGTCLSPILNEEKKERITCLHHLAAIFGAPLKPLRKAEAKILIEEVNRLMEQEVYRPRDSRGLPGGLLQLPEGLTPIIVADLHAQIDNLLVILSHNGFLQALEKGEACLVILGDAVHSERDDTLDEMDDSLLMMDMIFRLKLRFPENFFYVRGNHDSFAEEISKGGVPQGQLWKRALKKARGKEYRNAMQRYYDLLPYAVASPDFCAAHAAPPRSKISVDMLIDIHQHRGLIGELLNNRMQRSNRPGGYTKGDIRRFRSILGVSPETPLIVGHTPMGEGGAFWLNVGGAQNHHVLYSAGKTWVGVFTRIGGEMWPLKYPSERLRGLINSLVRGDRKSKKRRQAPSPGKGQD